MTLVDDALTVFRTEFPEYAGEEDADVRRQLGVALEIFSVRLRGTAYLAAHLLATRNSKTDNEQSPAVPDGGIKLVHSEKIGEKSVWYGRTAAVSPSGAEVHDLDDNDNLHQTEYGRTYMLIRDSATAITIRSF